MVISEDHFQTFALMFDEEEVGYISKNIDGALLLNLDCYLGKITSSSVCVIDNVDDFVHSAICTKESSGKHKDIVIKCYNDLFVHFKNSSHEYTKSSFREYPLRQTTEIRVYHKIVGLVCICTVDDVVDVTDKVYL
jgi:hypothetical protein